MVVPTGFVEHGWAAWTCACQSRPCVPLPIATNLRGVHVASRYWFKLPFQPSRQRLLRPALQSVGTVWAKGPSMPDGNQPYTTPKDFKPPALSDLFRYVRSASDNEPHRHAICTRFVYAQRHRQSGSTANHHF